MKIKFKIFRLDYTVDENLNYHPVLKPSGFKTRWNDDWDTKTEAVFAIGEYGDEDSEYVIQKVYSK